MLRVIILFLAVSSVITGCAFLPLSVVGLGFFFSLPMFFFSLSLRSFIPCFSSSSLCSLSLSSSGASEREGDFGGIWGDLEEDLKGDLKRNLEDDPEGAVEDYLEEGKAWMGTWRRT